MTYCRMLADAILTKRGRQQVLMSTVTPEKN